MARRPLEGEGKALVRNALDQANSHNVYLEKQAMWAVKRKAEEEAEDQRHSGRSKRETSRSSSRQPGESSRKRHRRHETEAVKEHRSNEENFWEAERERHAREKERHADRMLRRERQMRVLREVVAMPSSISQTDFLWSDDEDVSPVISHREKKKKKRKKSKHHKT
ncbi:hypothetical protein FOZ63_019819 [Perkinsus olseni]|uniref:Uncharacterized protein n=1 Tax=Perkinsus olseni TaxID=32597 RepID=A0A7J6RH23_PEROL|nr:hypothetical protein FOZ63_019819 [Perkinsus olseni]KAF4719350.1 hypothetical protein FOZ62_024582 [Perkinsus olseni]